MIFFGLWKNFCPASHWKINSMRTCIFSVAVLGTVYGHYLLPSISAVTHHPPPAFVPAAFPDGSWQHFLQNLPSRAGKVVDYTGTPIQNQNKHAAVINYDVGKRDLQQCADALIRLRAEYLFQQLQFDQIRFHFTSGQLYAWKDYCLGLLPRIRGSQVHFVGGTPRKMNYASLRAYLDIVYAYAGTQSLYRELKPAKQFEVGTIIITPGSPGHCCMIVDEAKRSDGKKVFKLAESYMPAQSIYILKNPVDGSPWHELNEGAPVRTASYYFACYSLRQF
jgi:hypothetical protein